MERGEPDCRGRAVLERPSHREPDCPNWRGVPTFPFCTGPSLWAPGRSGGSPTSPTARGRLFFVNAQYVAEQIKVLMAQYQPRVVALDMSRVPDIECSALQAIMEGEARSRERGAVMWLVGLNPGVLEVVRRAGLADRVGHERMLFNARVAIEHYQALQPPA